MSKFWRYGSKLTVEQVFSIDIRDLKREGLLDGNCYEKPYFFQRYGLAHSVVIEISTDPNDKYLGGRFIKFKYSLKEDNQERVYNYKIPISVTPCHFGGVRYWFRCYANLRHCCGNRVTTLFLGSAGIFACRHCYNLSYNARNKNRRESIYPILEKNRLIQEQAEILLSKGYRPHYAGLPTKKLLRYLKITRKIEEYNRMSINYPKRFFRRLNNART